VDQAVYPVEVHERPEVHQVRDGAMDDHTLLQRVEDALALLLALLLEDRASGEDDVVAAPVELDNLALQLLAQERLEVPHAPDIHEARREEAAQADVQDQAALDNLDDRAFDGAPLVVGVLDAVPGPLERRTFGREDQPPVGVLLLQDERLDALPELDHLLRVGPLADGELVRGDETLGLVADVHEDLVLVYADDLALDYVAVLEIYQDALVYGDYLPILFPEEVLHGQFPGCVFGGVSHVLGAFLLSLVGADYTVITRDNREGLREARPVPSAPLP
jgi:hypothetical protein